MKCSFFSAVKSVLLIHKLLIRICVHTFLLSVFIDHLSACGCLHKLQLCLTQSRLCIFKFSFTETGLTSSFPHNEAAVT